MHLQVVYLLTVMGTAACSCVANIRPKDLESRSSYLTQTVLASRAEITPACSPPARTLSTSTTTL